MFENVTATELYAAAKHWDAKGRALRLAMPT